MNMAIIHISEGEAARDFAGLLEMVRDGAEIIIDSDQAHAPSVRVAIEQSGLTDPKHDAWVRSMV